MTLAVMQPYAFPYVGYFQLINAVDTFVFCDDVNFIKRGWVNRNKILIDNKAYLLTLPCLKASRNKLINEVKIDMDAKEYTNVLLTIKHSYKKAPYFNDVYPILQSIFDKKFNRISDLAVCSIISVVDYLKLDKNFLFTSKNFGHTKGQDKSDRLINITKELSSSHYINPIGGVEIYDKSYFKKYQIRLSFLQPRTITYTQFDNCFIPNLSILDLLMFNSIDETKLLLEQYDLV